MHKLHTYSSFLRQHPSLQETLHSPYIPNTYTTYCIHIIVPLRRHHGHLPRRYQSAYCCRPASQSLAPKVSYNRISFFLPIFFPIHRAGPVVGLLLLLLHVSLSCFPSASSCGFFLHQDELNLSYVPPFFTPSAQIGLIKIACTVRKACWVF